MVLKLYGFDLSAPTRLAAIILDEKQVPFEFIPLDLSKGEHKRPEYFAKQPFGQVPCLDDDGFLLYEGRAICHIQAFALFEQAAASEFANFHVHARAAVYELIEYSWTASEGRPSEYDLMGRSEYDAMRALVVLLEYRIHTWDQAATHFRRLLRTVTRSANVQQRTVSSHDDIIRSLCNQVLEQERAVDHDE
ncbi:hypothetical protein M422DRAFT_261615 [Sphaerobolus stellatus SS14]|uniref:glutathione transferase n=1 Tax=Sphaerobolus stellatus (strain SS14) TaxID=990650 RepID=A0A0C9V2X9_SPHS4|nr:hypothetical protein M422DRAFT_261615 [Sphaerobolus stellatus SS14]